MHRRPLLDLLDLYGAAEPADAGMTARFKVFVRSRADCFQRACPPGHITASAWILDAGERRALLTHHRKLDRWLQCGGHADGDPAVEAVALREAREESGLERFRFPLRDGRLVPLDLDIHPIPERGGEPAHLHYDVRFLLVAAPGQSVRASGESWSLRWFAEDELGSVTGEESVLRLARKARERLRYSRP